MQIKRIDKKNSISMGGIIKIKGATSAITLRENISKSAYFNNLAKTNDIVARLSYKIPENNSNDVIFKIKYSILKENSIMDKMLDFLHMKQRLEYNEQYLEAKDLIKLLKK